LFPDTVHPNAEGARLIAVTIYQALTGKEVPADTK
jgi:lysophospholipase L1-like esterase